MFAYIVVKRHGRVRSRQRLALLPLAYVKMMQGLLPRAHLEAIFAREPSLTLRLKLKARLLDHAWNRTP